MLPVKVKNRNNNSSRYDANEHWTRKEKRSEVEVVIMDTNKKRFLLTYGTPLIYGGTLHEDLGTLA